MVTAFVRSGQEDLLAPYATAFLDEAAQVHERLGTQKAQVALRYGFPLPLASPELVEQIDAWLASTSANAGAQRFVREHRSEVLRVLAARAADAG